LLMAILVFALLLCCVLGTQRAASPNQIDGDLCFTSTYVVNTAQDRSETAPRQQRDNDGQLASTKAMTGYNSPSLPMSEWFKRAKLSQSGAYATPSFPGSYLNSMIPSRTGPSADDGFGNDGLGSYTSRY